MRAARALRWTLACAACALLGGPLLNAAAEAPAATPPAQPQRPAVRTPRPTPPMSAVERGFRPLLSVAGGTDSMGATDGQAHQAARAIALLRRWMDASAKAIHEVKMDASTAAFVARMWTSVEDFDLEGLYEDLPEPGPDRWRSLPVFGEPRADHYFVGRPKRGAAFEVRAGGPRQQLAAGSFLLRMRPVENRIDPDDDDPNYRIELRTGLVVGDVPFAHAARAQQDLLTLLSTTPRAGRRDAKPLGGMPSARALELASTRHPKLGAEDLTPVATLFEAFPFSMSLLSDFIEVEDVLGSPRADDVQQLRIAGRLVPARFAERYPDLAAHARDLSRLLHVELHWIDSRGRTLARGVLDTEALRVDIECHVRDGQLVPTRGQQVFAGDALQPLSSEERRSRIVAHATLRAMGVTTVARDLVMQLRYRASGERASLEGRMTTLPKVRVSGALMGLIPTGVVDFFIPGNLKQLITDFVTTATTGNAGRGIRARLQLGRSGPARAATLEALLELEALDNALVRMGVQLAMDRIIFDEDATGEAEHLGQRIHAALRRDLERYAKRAAIP